MKSTYLNKILECLCSLRMCSHEYAFMVLLNPFYEQIHIDLAPNIEVNDIQKTHI